MPIYEYACQKCGKRTEAIQQVGEKPLRICPHCGGALKKLLSSAAIQFKGSGWYVTDYSRAKKEEKNVEKKEEKASSEKSESAEKPTEKKKEGGGKKGSE